MGVNRRCALCPINQDWPIGTKFCPDHGEKIKDFPRPKCPKCGKHTKGKPFCWNCGASCALPVL